MTCRRFVSNVLRALCLIFITGLLISSKTLAQPSGGERFALIIGGLGGSPEYTEKFQQYIYEVHKALVDQFAFPADQVVVLAENNIVDLPFVHDVSTAENI